MATIKKFSLAELDEATTAAAVLRARLLDAGLGDAGVVKIQKLLERQRPGAIRLAQRDELDKMAKQYSKSEGATHES